MWGYVGSAAVSSASLGFSATRKVFSVGGYSDLSTRVLHAILLLGVAVIAFILQNFGKQMLSWIPYVQLCEDAECVGTLSTYRLTLALFLLHAFLALVTIGITTRRSKRAQIQNSWWSLKLLFVVAFSVGSFFIPYMNEFLIGFGWFALVGSSAFILLQLLLLIEFSYTWAASWISRALDSRLWVALLFASALGLYGFSVVVTVIIYVFYSNLSSCWFTPCITTLHVITCIVYSLLSLYPRVQAAHKHGTGLLQSGVVTAYSTFLIWSAAQSVPSELGCNPFSYLENALGKDSAVGLGLGHSARLAVLLCGSVFTLAAVCFAAIRTSSRHSAGVLDSPVLDHTSDVGVELNEEKSEGNYGRAGIDPSPKMDEDVEEGGEGSEEGDRLVSHEDAKEEGAEATAEDEDGVKYSYAYFHMTFALACLYIAMLITSWRVVSRGDEADPYRVGSGFPAVYVKVASAFIAAGIYVWSLLAPMCFPSREFDF